MSLLLHKPTFANIMPTVLELGKELLSNISLWKQTVEVHHSHRHSPVCVIHTVSTWHILQWKLVLKHCRFVNITTISLPHIHFVSEQLSCLLIIMKLPRSTSKDYKAKDNFIWLQRLPPSVDMEHRVFWSRFFKLMGTDKKSKFLFLME